jgi:Glycosyl transferase family 2
VLLTELYDESDARRRSEFLECLQRNAANDLVSEVHVFVEAAQLALLDDPKLRRIEHGRRVTYRELFAYANEHLPGKRVIIANADIYFDGTLARLADEDLSGKLLCLSRWDVQSDGSSVFFEHPWSQDAWVFDAPLPLFSCDFPPGVPGCDNRLAWEAAHAGLTLANPSRSVRAHHLHLSQVRRYSERQRLPGPSAAVAPELLGTPWLWFVVPCMGRLADVQQTADSLLAQPRSSYLLVDYSCPDEAGLWARANRAQVEVLRVDGQARFRGADARNRGAASVDDDAVICFIDADVGVKPAFSDHVLHELEPNCFLVPDRQGPGLDTTLVCRKADFDRVHGFDEAFQDWGEECADLRAALGSLVLLERTFPASLLAPLGRRNGNTRSFRSVPDAELTSTLHRSYRRAKAAVLEEIGRGQLSTAARREIYAAVMRNQLRARGLIPDLPCASVVFAESMGYTIAKLEVGASSHNNEARPFTIIPEPLEGLQFTQVVASRVSPLDVRFVTAGKLFVLVGNDWDGSEVARAWLADAAFDERLPAVETQSGAGFEVWSLAAEAGGRFELPTQVMLVAAELTRV